MRPDPVTTYACCIVIGWTVLGWIPVDLWLHAHGHPYLTDQFRAWLHSPKYGWALWGGIIALPVMFFAHLLIVAASKSGG